MSMVDPRLQPNQQFHLIRLRISSFCTNGFLVYLHSSRLFTKLQRNPRTTNTMTNRLAGATLTEVAEEAGAGDEVVIEVHALRGLIREASRLAFTS